VLKNLTSTEEKADRQKGSLSRENSRHATPKANLSKPSTPFPDPSPRNSNQLTMKNSGSSLFLDRSEMMRLNLIVPTPYTPQTAISAATPHGKSTSSTSLSSTPQTVASTPFKSSGSVCHTPMAAPTKSTTVVMDFDGMQSYRLSPWKASSSAVKSNPQTVLSHSKTPPHIQIPHHDALDVGKVLFSETENQLASGSGGGNYGNDEVACNDNNHNLNSSSSNNSGIHYRERLFHQNLGLPPDGCQDSLQE